MNSWLHPASTANWQTTELLFELLGIRLAAGRALRVQFSHWPLEGDRV